METKLYYTRDEVLNKTHFKFVDNGKDIYLYQNDGNFEIYKSLFLLKPNATELSEIYVELKVYMVVVEHLNNKSSRWMNEFDAYVFYSVKDYFEKLDEANKNRLF